MKKLLFTALLVAGSYCSQSQTKGTNTIGMGIGFSTNEETQNDQTYKQTSQNYSVNYGRFVRENLKLGVSANFSRSKRTSTVHSDITTDQYGAGILLNRYFPLMKKLYLVGGGDLNYFYGKNSNYNDNVPIKSRQYSIQVGAGGGLSYFLSPKLALETQLSLAQISYTESKTRDERSAKASHFGISTGGGSLLYNFGYTIHFLF